MSAAEQAGLFGEEPVLRITIPGKPVSGNEKNGIRVIPKDVFVPGKGPVRKHVPITYTTREGKAFDEKVKSLAMPVVFRANWKMPEYVRMDVTLYNLNMDRDNVNKTVADALQGLAFIGDSRVLDGQITKRKDKNGPRVEVIIRAVDGGDYGY